MPLISIVVPVYNVERYLRACLDSALAQTFADWECVLVDDGSPDGCPEICDEYAGRDGRFRALHQENGGLSAARNAGVRAARGEYIALLDGDDRFAAEDALENAAQVIRETGENAVYNPRLAYLPDTGRGNVTAFEIKAGVYFFDYFFDYFFEYGVLGAWLWIVRREFIIENNLFFREGLLHEDVHWDARLICACEKIAVNDHPYYCYRSSRENSIMSRVTPERLESLMVILEDLLAAAETAREKKRAGIYRAFCKLCWEKVFCGLHAIEKEHPRKAAALNAALKKYSFTLLTKASGRAVSLKSLVKYVCARIDPGASYKLFLAFKKRRRGSL
jgi:glycosyltransferase involved in cell wall biosynthesis